MNPNSCWNVPPQGGDIPVGGETAENAKANTPPETIAGLAKARAERPDDAEIKAKLDNCIHSQAKELCENPPVDPQRVESLKGEIKTAMDENPVIAGELGQHIDTIQRMVNDGKERQVQVASADPNTGVATIKEKSETNTGENTEDPSVAHLDRHSEIPEVAATQVVAKGEEPMKIPEVYGPTMVDMYKGQAQAKTMEISESHEAIGKMVEATDLSPEAKKQIMENIKQLEYYPAASEQEIVAMVLAGVKGVTAEQLKNSPYFEALKGKLKLIQERNEIQENMAKRQKEITLENVSAMVDVVIKDSALYENMLSPETLARFKNFTNKYKMTEIVLTLVKPFD